MDARDRELLRMQAQLTVLTDAVIMYISLDEKFGPNFAIALRQAAEQNLLSSGAEELDLEDLATLRELETVRLANRISQAIGRGRVV